MGERTISLNKIEPGILIKTLRGRNIEPWLIRGSFDYSIYPYELDNDGTRLLSVEEMEKMYPNTYSYLLKNKEGLLRRKDSRREVAESKQWYSLIRKGRLDTFRSSKIVTPALTKHNSFAFDNEASAFLTGGAGVFSMIQERFDSCYLLAVLNSKLIEFFLHQISTKKQGGYYSYLHTFLAQIPIVELGKSEQIPFAQLAEAIIENKRELEVRVNKFLNRVNERFPKMKLTKNLACFYKMDFASFLKELRKANKDNIKLGLRETDEWEDYFETHKAQVLASLNNVSELETKLDTKVFDLYGLSEPQRSAVLDSFSSD